jgi:phosphoribosyl 1,2-cyclic phosphate phosphodiesterase
MLEINVLGCGSSLGVPVLGCSCQVCISEEIFNKRSRSAILIKKNNITILVDAGPDIRNQLLRNKTSNIDAIIITHAHADHINGIDDLRVLSKDKPLDLYTTEEAAIIIRQHFNYLINRNIICLHICNYYQIINIFGVDIYLLKQNHGKIDSLGILVENFAYVNDIAYFPTETLSLLKQTKYWLVDCISYNSNNHHSGLDKVMNWANEFILDKAYLTNMSHHLDYYKLLKDLPDNIQPAYDGLKIIIS